MKPVPTLFSHSHATSGASTRDASTIIGMLSLFAQFEAGKTPYHNVLASFGDHFANEITHDDGFILDPGLHHQHLLAEHLLELTIDKFVALLLWDTLDRRVFQDHFARLLHGFRR